MSDTPRTDAAEWKSQYGRVECLVVEADFARALERELLAALEARGVAILERTATQLNAEGLERELAKAKQQLHDTRSALLGKGID